MMPPPTHEELHVVRGRRSGLRVIVAVHSTVLGPALGGARLWRYGTPGDAVADALRLSEAMTMKAAAAGLPLGGGKCVLCAEGELSAAERRNLMLDLGDAVEGLQGRYITAEDVGTGPEDMAVAAERTAHIVGLPPELGGYGDPSPLTARGVEAAIRACLEFRFGDAGLRGRRICVVGLGHVGLTLARGLAGAGAELTVTDIDESKRVEAAALDATWVDPAEAIEVECDVLAPCALGGAIGSAAARRLRCAIVCGAANNVLTDDAVAQELAQRDVLYAPDFIANAGGLISVYAELERLPSERVDGLVDEIGLALTRILARAGDQGSTPLEAAREIAQARLEGKLDEDRRQANSGGRAFRAARHGEDGGGPRLDEWSPRPAASQVRHFSHG